MAFFLRFQHLDVLDESAKAFAVGWSKPLSGADKYERESIQEASFAESSVSA